MATVRLLLIMLCFSLPFGVFAGVLKGKVVDDKGAKLPFATIFIEGTTIGVNANGNGDFELTVAPGLYKVVCQYIGYKQSHFNLDVTGAETIEHIFILKDQSLEIKEVVIHANSEDPAYEIIRNTIKRRSFHLDQVHSFQSDIYLKGSMRSRKMPKKFMGQKTTDETDIVDSVGKGVLFLTEEDASYYSQGNKSRTVIHSVHQSGNPAGLGFAQFPSVITFYDNNVNVLGNQSRGFISPVSDNALLYYNYKLLGQFQEQGATIYKIEVTPRRAYEPCFTGTIYIADKDWAIHSLDMTLAKKSGMDIIDTLKISQLFLPVSNDLWVVKSQVIYFTVNLLGFDVTAGFVTVYNNQKVNEPIPDSVFADKIVSSYDRTANKKDSAYWKTNRPIPLEVDEQRDFVSKDSLRTRNKSPEYVDSMRRKGNKVRPMAVLFGGYTYTGKGRKNVLSTNSLLLGIKEDNIVNFNTVEGFNVAPKIVWKHFIDSGKTLMGESALRYGFANAHFDAIARLYVVSKDRTFLNRSWTYGVEGGKYVYQYNSDNPVLPWFNTYAALFYRVNDLKLYERQDATVYLARNYGTGLSWYAKASYQQRLPLYNTTTYSFIKGDLGDYKDNMPPYLAKQSSPWGIKDAAIVTASVSYKPGYSYIQYPDFKAAVGSKWPTFRATYTKGIPGVVNSVSDFDKWRFSVQDEVSLRLMGTFIYHFATGGFLNTNYVAAPDLMHLYGNRGIGYASPYLNTFQFAQYYEFSNKEKLYGEAHVEYHLRGLLSNKIPLLRQARWYIVTGGNAFYASGTDYYTEAFAGLENIGYKIARVIRVDFVQSWDSHTGRNSGLRFGLTFPGLGEMKSYPMHGEW